MRSNRQVGTGVSRGWVLGSAGLVVLAAVAMVAGSRLQPATSAAPQYAVASGMQTSVPQKIHGTYGQLPLMFETNQGQSDPRVKFLARGGAYGLFLMANEAVLALQARGRPSTHVVRMALVDANPQPEVAGVDALPGKSNYLIGNDASKWRQGVPQFARVRYSAIYPGIDLVYYGQQGRLEYDFEVAPGADPNQIALQFGGPQALNLDENGDLVLEVGDDQVVLHAPRVYQKSGQGELAVPSRFVRHKNETIGFEVGDYDRTRTLVIDPVLSYSTYLGGGGVETFPKIAVDSAANAYVAGSTTSADFPIPSGTTPFQADLAAGSDVFVAKFNAAGSALVFATYLGGDGTDAAAGIAVDTALGVVVTGVTSSTDFPVAGAFQSSATTPGNHVFVSRLDKDGKNLLYSTYLSGNGTDIASGVTLDISDKIYVTGSTTSTNFPTTSGAFQTASLASNQFFVSKVDPSATAAASLPYSTYFGGSNPTNGSAVGGGIAVDRNKNVYFTGTTNFVRTSATGDFPILNAFQGCLNQPTNPSTCPTGDTHTDAFVAKLNPAAGVGSQLIYSTYIGGAGDDAGNAVAVDASSGVAYVTGSTNSASFPATSGTITPFQKCLNEPTVPNPATCTVGGSNTDAFLAKLGAFTSSSTSAPNVTLVYFSYLGGGANEVGWGIGVDSAQAARITGSTTSGNFPVRTPSGTAIQATSGGGMDAFVARIDTTATAADAAGHNSTYLGGSGDDRGTGLALDLAGAAYIAGETASGNFPRVTPFQNALAGSSDAFVSKIGGVVDPTITAEDPDPDPVGSGNEVTFEYTIKNNGDLLTGLIFTDTIAAGSTFVSANPSGSGGTCPSTATGNPPTVTCSLNPINPQATVTMNVRVRATGSPATPVNNSASLLAPGLTTPRTANASAAVSDFAVAITPSSRSVAAGESATYSVQVSSIGAAFPNALTVGTCSGLPSGANCSVANSSITNLNSGPQSRSVVVTTTPRTTTISGLRLNHTAIYAMWLPLSGLAFLGLGAGGKMSRHRRIVMALLVGGLVALILFLPACGSDSSSNETTTGTPPGTYQFTINVTSGSTTHSQTAQLEVHP